MRLHSLRFALAAALCTVAVSAQSPRVQPLLGAGEGPTAPPTLPVTTDALFSDAGTGPQEINIEINAKDWQALKDNYLANTYYPADFKWNGQIVRNVGVRSRGTASRSPTKPGVRIDFDRYTAGQKLMGLKSVILKNNVTDPSNLHERVAFKLFERLGFVEPRETPVRVMLNGVYDGLYSLVETPDKDFLKRAFAQNDGNYYKFDRNVGDDPYRFEYLGTDTTLYVPHHWQPETHEDDPQPQPIVDMIRTIAESTEVEFKATLGNYLDIDQVLKHLAIENYLAEVDGILGESGMNNFYAYRLQGTTKHVLIPWDKSETFRSGPTFDVLHNIQDVPVQFHNRLVDRFWKFNELQQSYFDYLVAAANSASETVAGDARTWMEKEIDREFAQIKDAVATDPKRPNTNDEFLAAVEAMRVFARQRPQIVRDESASHRPQ